MYLLFLCLLGSYWTGHKIQSCHLCITPFSATCALTHTHYWPITAFPRQSCRNQGGQGGQIVPSDLGKYITLLQSVQWCIDYARHFTTYLPDFQTFLRHFLDMYILQICEYVSPKIRTDCFSNNINSLSSLLHTYSVKEVPSLKVSFSHHVSM